MGKIMKQEKEELTGLYTADTAKMMIEEYLEKEQENVGMIVLDLDGFEQVNTMFDEKKGTSFCWIQATFCNSLSRRMILSIVRKKMNLLSF